MKNDRLVLVGDCLGDMWTQLWTNDTVIDHKQNDFNLIDVFKTGAGANNIGVHSLLEYYLRHGSEVKDTTVIVQFTGLDRHGTIIDDDNPEHGLLLENWVTGKTEKIVARGLHLDDVYPQEVSRRFWPPKIYQTDDHMLRDLLSIMCLYSDAGADVYGFRGWGECMSGETWIKMKAKARQHNVTLSNICYVDTAINNANKNIYPLDDPDYWNGERPVGPHAFYSIKAIVESLKSMKQRNFTNG